EDGIRDKLVTGVQTCALPIWQRRSVAPRAGERGVALEERLRDHQRVGAAHQLASPRLGNDRIILPDLVTSPVVGVVSETYTPHRSEERRVGKGCRPGGSP